MADPASIGLSIIDYSGPEPVLHVRNWVIPAHLAATFAEQMTARFGQPDEMFGNPEALQRAGARTADEDGTVYMMADEP